MSGGKPHTPSGGGCMAPGRTRQRSQRALLRLVDTGFLSHSATAEWEGTVWGMSVEEAIAAIGLERRWGRAFADIRADPILSLPPRSDLAGSAGGRVALAAGARA
jgi:hypothetical protein